MGKCILVVGGTRSGKSDFAQEMAEQISPDKKYYIATCPSIINDDSETLTRIEKHKLKRQGRGWETIEEQINLCQALENISSNSLVLIDCLTLWVSNFLFKKSLESFGELELESELAAIMDHRRKRSGDVVFVSGEVGCGIVPENALARRYRDLVGLCNQYVAKSSDKVFLVSCGIPTLIKGK